ncbi:hypothetical protein ACGFY7_47205 [Streptomyces prunicolor]|uniref:hypothetical protein n=1 Tax=Streptomyces prunicolor TaxID=67348 RepID=UPI00371A10A3
MDQIPVLSRTFASWHAPFLLLFLLSVGLAWVPPYAYVLWFLAPPAAGYGGPLVGRLRSPGVHGYRIAVGGQGGAV